MCLSFQKRYYHKTCINPISHGRWSWRLPVYSNHQLSNKDRAAWQKTWWQYGFKYPTYFGRISFIIHYQIVGKFWIWKCSVKTFLIFHAFFINLWSRGKHSWLWIWKPRVRFPVTPTFSLRKRKGTAGIWTQDPWVQSQLYLPLDHKLMKNAWKIKKNLSTYFQIQNSLNFW